MPRLLALLQEGRSMALVSKLNFRYTGYCRSWLLPAAGPGAACRTQLSPFPVQRPPWRRFPLPDFPWTALSLKGFCQSKAVGAGSVFEALREEPRTVVLYESPYRLVRLLRDIATCLGPERRVVVTRELTKHFEEVQRGTAAALLDVFQERTVRGECTVLIAGRPA